MIWISFVKLYNNKEQHKNGVMPDRFHSGSLKTQSVKVSSEYMISLEEK